MASRQPELDFNGEGLAEKPEVQLPEGAKLLEEYITTAQEDDLIQAVDKESWLVDLKRRVQHYGYSYDYRARSVNLENKIGDLPEWITQISESVGQEFFNGHAPDQLIVNEYRGAQGIAPHVDCEPCFMDGIVSISLLEPCRMDFVHQKTQKQMDCILPPRSLLFLEGESRYDWTHGIRPNKNTIVDEKKLERGRRLSLTFRRVILED
ncbi:TPA: alpha-ketoglutarate-dependent dioxygenase AlkB [Candidatus Poribacteria bacterium]|nr:alpha-ketoglutarate-dependent dioxygenase AlkB [Candidatus Poribacteria bacterium]